MGQRQTDSGSALFERVRVEAAELLLDPGPLSTPHAALRPLLAQLILAHLFLGIAQGALEQARGYTLNEARPGQCPGTDRKSTRLNSSHSQISYAVFSLDKKSTRLNSSHSQISYAVFCLKKKKHTSQLNSQKNHVCRLILEKKKELSHTHDPYPTQIPHS